MSGRQNGDVSGNFRYGKDRPDFAQARQFVITAFSIIPGGVAGFIIVYWIGRRRHALDS